MVCFIFHFGTSRHESIYVFSTFFKKVLLCLLFVRPTVRPSRCAHEKGEPKTNQDEPKTNQDELKASQRQTKGVGAMKHKASQGRAEDEPKTNQRRAKDTPRRAKGEPKTN